MMEIYDVSRFVVGKLYHHIAVGDFPPILRPMELNRTSTAKKSTANTSAVIAPDYDRPTVAEHQPQPHNG